MSDAIASLGRPLGLRLLLDRAVTLVRRHGKTIYPAMALPAALLQLGVVVAANRWTAHWMRSLRDAESGDLSQIFSGCSGFAIGWSVMMVLYLVWAAALGRAALDGALGQPIAMGRAWRWAFDSERIGTLFLVGLAVGLGFLALIVPGVLLFLRWNLVLPVMAAEGIGGSAAMRRSWALMKYNPRRQLAASPMVKMLVVLVVGYLISLVVSLLLQLPFSLAQQFLTLRRAAAGVPPEELLAGAGVLSLQMISALLGSLAQSVVAVYISFAVSLLYLDLRHRMEGEDLEAALSELESTGLPSATPATEGEGPGA